ncbi:MAG: putative metallopeptidase [Candidatus Levyibacteriota bacterium]
MEWEEAKEVKKDIKKILHTLNLSHVRQSRVYCFKTKGSKSRAYARIWSFPKIFQDVLQIEPAYVIEVLSKYYDKLNDDQKIHVLIHELLHIPKNFSGSLLPHRGRNRHLNTQAKKLFSEYKSKLKK